MISVIADGTNIPVQFIRFSDGASNVKLHIPEDFKASNYVSLSVHPGTPADDILWEILLVASAIGEAELIGNWGCKRILNLSYLPHGRADRVFEKGNANPLLVFSHYVFEIFNEVIIKDIHNREAIEDFTIFGKTKFTEVTQAKCFKETFHREKISLKDLDVILVSPDKGASEKIQEVRSIIFRRGGYAQVLECSKLRNPSNGKVISTFVPNVNLANEHVIICDDILDGGGTFIPLAEQLRTKGAKTIDLYITHGIFAKGVDIFNNIVDNIYVNQIVGQHITMQDIHNFNSKKEIFI